MLRHRIIPVLLNTRDGLVKTKKFRDPVYIGDPINALRIFNQKFVDEIILLDIERSKFGFAPDFSLIEMLTSECFMPLGYGGGIRNLEDAKRLLGLGVEKLILQSSVFANRRLIADIAEHSGSQSVAVALDVVSAKNGDVFVYSSSNRSRVDVPFEQYVEQIQNDGAGEIILTSVDREGTMTGYDLELVRKVSSLVRVPLVVHGGARNLQDFADAINCGANAVAAGSLFVFYGARGAVLINYPQYSELEYLLEPNRGK